MIARSNLLWSYLMMALLNAVFSRHSTLLRQILVHDSRRRKLVSGAKDAEFVKLLKVEMLARFCVV